MFRSKQASFLVLPGDLQAFAWSAPMRDLAAKVGMSDVGLKKLLRNHDISPPPQGHWNRVKAGRPVPDCPAGPERWPGQSGRILLDPRFAGLVEETGPIDVDGPFASRHVSEDLEVLRGNELKALGKVSVPKQLYPAHRGLWDLLKQEEKRREKFLERDYSFNEPWFDSPFDQRRLRFLSGLYKALEKRGHTGSAYANDNVLSAYAMIGDTQVGLALEPVKKGRGGDNRRGWRSIEKLPANTPMKLTVHATATRHWQDDENGKLESKLPAIAADLIVAGEERFRTGLREAREREAEYQRYLEKERQRKLAALEAERLAKLEQSSALLRKAEDIRALVSRMKKAVLAGDRAIDLGELAAWEAWANDYADRLDPVKSGQVLEHLKPPVLKEESNDGYL